MVANFVSAMAAEAFISALTIEPAVIPADKATFPVPSKEMAEAVTSPVMEKSRAVASLAAISDCKAAVKSFTSAPEPAPSARTIAPSEAKILTLPPDPCVMVTVWFVLFKNIYIRA